jgi:two-component system, NtrC family, nitrogen regulation sensor histidine kinase NtrY
MSERRHINKWWLIFGGGSLVLLAAAIFTLGSLNAPVHPERGNAFVILFALSTFLVAAFLVFSLILVRSLLRLGAERRAGQLGSRFKTKMVLGAMGISVIPVIFLFFISYALVNRTLILWFPRPLELANQQNRQLVEEMSRMGRDRLRERAAKAGAWLDAPGKGRTPQAYLAQFASDIDALWTAGPEGGEQNNAAPLQSDDSQFHLVRKLSSEAEIWQGSGKLYMAGRAPYRGGYVLAGRVLPADFLARYSESEVQTLTYEQQRQHLRAYKSEILLFLSLVTVLILFASTWVALFLSKQVTVPIQALAEATQEVAAGNLAHRVSVQAQDELGTLVNSFNQMTAQLGEGRKQIDDFTRNLQVAIEEIERRRNLMEAILENIPTGVLSLDPDGGITRTNSAVARIFGERSRGAHTLGDLLGEEAARESLQLMRRSLRMGAASRELEISVPGRLLHAAVTVSSLGPRRSNPGFVVVIDDLTELLRAQKSSAWQAVAQRIAHEIKNPLTPIQLSAQRLLRHLDRGPTGDGKAGSDFEKVVGECASLIEQEVQTLESLVDEFSQFARFPAAKLAPADLNGIVRSALDVFHGRLEGIVVRTELAAALPPVRADAELLRRVFVNLIDNAAEALEGATMRTLTVVTRLDPEGDAVEIEVSDSGHGISPEDKDKLFLPHFSTKDRGTGLGLAIASRIVAEHHGTIKAEDNSPSGTRFLIRFPVAEVPAAQPSSHA